MYELPTDVTELVHDAQNGRFSALVIIHDREDTYSYTCSITAPNTLSLDAATKQLRHLALGKHCARQIYAGHPEIRPAAARVRRPGRQPSLTADPTNPAS